MHWKTELTDGRATQSLSILFENLDPAVPEAISLVRLFSYYSWHVPLCLKPAGARCVSLVREVLTSVGSKPALYQFHLMNVIKI